MLIHQEQRLQTFSNFLTMSKNPFHVMIVPTLGCPSNCAYCWSSDEHSPVMKKETIDAVATWLQDAWDGPVTFTFHGGEPLLAGYDFFSYALPLLAERFSEVQAEFAIQTNLWLMTPELAELFAAYHIPIGSSIDGPEDITDSQRGRGYFERTMQGYQISREKGLSVRFICTFTSRSIAHKEEIVSFFAEHGFPLKLHPALPSMKSDTPSEWALEPTEYGDLLSYLLDVQLLHLDEMTIMNIHDLCRSVFTGYGSVCTYADCMGYTFAIGPDGSIYPCYRFIGMPAFVMGSVHDVPKPTREDLMNSAAGRVLDSFREVVDRSCQGCRHISSCRGGCPYNAIVPTDGKMEGVDPYCEAYKRIFDEIRDRLDTELYAPKKRSKREQRKSVDGIQGLVQRLQ
jgi:uncharacterized protein